MDWLAEFFTRLAKLEEILAETVTKKNASFCYTKAAFNVITYPFTLLVILDSGVTIYIFNN